MGSEVAVGPAATTNERPNNCSELDGSPVKNEKEKRRLPSSASLLPFSFG
jgi:hypothetical protein